MRREDEKLRTRAAAISSRADLNDGDGPILWVLVTESPVQVYDWRRDEMVDEILLASGMVVPASGQVPLLDTHSRYTIASLHGHVKNFSEGEVDSFPACLGEVFFAEDDESVVARQKVRGGHLTDGSVGFKPLKSLYIPEGEAASFSGRRFEGPALVVYEWLLKEFSLCPVGADSLAKKQ